MPSAIVVKTAAKLGYKNIFRVLFYKLGVKTGLLPVKGEFERVRAEGTFFSNEVSRNGTPKEPKVTHSHTLFSWYPLASEGTPNWHKNYFSGASFSREIRKKTWWSIPDFGNHVGDIKTIWELSRFDWVVKLALSAKEGDTEALDTLNNWLDNWCEENPPYMGPNWKCGQEASIRVIHLIMASLVLDDQEASSSKLTHLVHAHLKRIRPTLMYALAQDNNHATSEAAALFVGGEWLESQGISEGARWAKTGRKWLNERAQRLILADGSFSQHSVTYHRLMLDTYGVVLLWIHKRQRPNLERDTLDRLISAANWLFQLTDPMHGDAPNYGANDGANLLTETLSPYRDFRPTVALITSLIEGPTVNDVEQVHRYFRLATVPLIRRRTSTHFPDGGYATLVNDRSFVFFSYPKYRFRPSQADAMHIDLWVNGNCILRDNGTFSYNASSNEGEYFPGTSAHNTVEFDARDQMPRIGRFLYGEWLEASDVQFDSSDYNSQEFGASYVDWKGACHKRKVKLQADSLEIIDQISGFSKQAVLRWHLADGKWHQDGNVIRSDNVEFVISSDTKITSIELVESDCSRYYMKKETFAAIEIKLRGAGRIVTKVRF